MLASLSHACWELSPSVHKVSNGSKKRHPSAESWQLIILTPRPNSPQATVRGSARWFLVRCSSAQGAIFQNKNSTALYWGITGLGTLIWLFQETFLKTLLSPSEEPQKLHKSRETILKSHTGCYTPAHWCPLFTQRSIFYVSFLFAYVYFIRIGSMLSIPAFFKLGCIGEFSPTEKIPVSMFSNLPEVVYT